MPAAAPPAGSANISPAGQFVLCSPASPGIDPDRVSVTNPFLHEQTQEQQIIFLYQLVNCLERAIGMWLSKGCAALPGPAGPGSDLA